MASGTRGQERNFYKILGVSSTASVDDIRKAYRALARQYHPDKVHDQEKARQSEKIFQEITAAYYVLSDLGRRFAYDATVNPREFEKRSREEMTADLANEILQEVMKHFLKAFEVWWNAPAEIEEQRRQYCSNMEDVTTLKMGDTYNDTVYSRRALFLKLSISELATDAEYVIRCVSANRSNFKLVLYDDQGDVEYSDTSKRMGEKTEVCLRCQGHRKQLKDGTFRTIPALGVGDHLSVIYNENILLAAPMEIKWEKEEPTMGCVIG